MDESIKKEQEKLANHLKNLSPEARQKEGMAIMCYMQGYEVGYQTAMEEKCKKKK